MKRALFLLFLACILPAEAISQSSSTFHIFPQFADGAFVDGSRYRSTLMATNSETTSTNCVLRLRGLTTSFRDVQGNATSSGDTFTITLTAGGWTILQSQGVQNIATGYATLQCDRSVTAQLLYALYDRNGNKISETAVFGAPRLATVQFLADQREGARIGVAVANDSDSAAEFDVFAGDAQGRLIGAATINVAARSSIAKFLDEWIAVPSAYVGQVVITSRLSSAPPAVVGLQFTGASFATIAVSAGTFPPGAASPPPSVIPSPAGLRLTPNMGAVGSTVNVTIEGAGFVQGATTLSISGTAVTIGSLNVVSATSLTAVIAINPPHSLGKER